MSDLLHILAISGSTRKSSSNLNLIRAIAHMTPDRFHITIFENIDQVPHFNPDLLGDTLPETVIRFRDAISAADAVLICTPEYAAGVPGTLKNAIDWMVSTTAFSHKPVALITAATSGRIAHQSLLGTLLLIEAKITAAMQLVIAAVKTKVNSNDRITDATTMEQVTQLIEAMEATVKHPGEQTYLPPPAIG